MIMKMMNMMMNMMIDMIIMMNMNINMKRQSPTPSLVKKNGTPYVYKDMNL